MPKYAKQNVTKHERDRARRQRQHLRLADFYGLVMPTAAQIASYSNPVAPLQHDHTAQLDAWADHVARGFIVR